MKVARRGGWVLLALVMMLGARAAAFAGGDRGASLLRGAVRDPEARAVVDAALVIRNDATGSVRTAVTNGSGRFEVADLQPGTYTIEVAVPGFELVRRTGVALAADQANEISIQLSVANISESVTVSAALPAAAVAAPSQASLTARSAVSLISNEYIRNYTSPFSDYSQVLQMAPGTFSTSANGPGLSDTKTFFRGFKDGYYSMTYDGIPFNDTNDPTHHSWVFFPAQTIGLTVFDRSPGSAATIGPSTFGGSVNLISRSVNPDEQLNGTVSYGSFNTRLFDLEFHSGRLGASGKSRLMVEAHDMRSDGYQTFNNQQRDAFSAKYQYTATANTTITAVSSIMNLNSNTPNQKGATRAQIAQFGDNFLMSGDPSSPMYYKFNFYHIPTNFEYVGLRTIIGGGWSIDTKVYTMRYHNQQNYNGLTKINATSATDKLNAYWKVGTCCRSATCRTGASSARASGPSTPRRIAIRRPPIRARGWMPRCRTSTRRSARRRCSRTPNTSCARGRT